MSEIINQLLPILGRTTLALALATLAAAALLRIVRPASPTVHRAGWILALLVGWSFLRLPVFIPWHDAAISDHQPVLTISEVNEIMVIDHSEISLPPSHEMEAPLASNISEPVVQNFDWPLALFFLWILGMAMLTLSGLVGYLYFVFRLPQGQQADPAWGSQWLALLSANGVRHSIPLRVTAGYGPMLCRLPRGYEVVIPVDLWQELNSSQREAILRHELAHYQRGDIWKSLAVRVLALPHWFNPASWYAVRGFDESAERACDLAAASHHSLTAYAEALLKLGTPASFFAPYTSSARGRSLAKRIRHLLTEPPEKDSTMKKILLTMVATCLVTVALVRVELVAKESPDSTTENTQSQVSQIAKKDLRYEGKDFATWVHELRTELSPERRTKAIHALTTFAANGYGREATAAILDAMRGGIPRNLESAAYGKLYQTASDAITTIDPTDVTPVVYEAIKSSRVEKRLVALRMAQRLIREEKDLHVFYPAMEKDEDSKVRNLAFSILATAFSNSPEFRPFLMEALIEKLKDKDPVIAGMALRSLLSAHTARGARPPRGGMPTRAMSLGDEEALSAEEKIKQAMAILIEIVGREDDGYQQLRISAIMSLSRLGPAATDAIPALEQAMKSKDEEIATAARESLESIKLNLSESASELE